MKLSARNVLKGRVPPEQLVVMQRAPAGISLNDLIERHLGAVDIVLVEGYRELPIPKIEVLADGRRPYVQAIHCLLWLGWRAPVCPLRPGRRRGTRRIPGPGALRSASLALAEPDALL